MDVDRWSTPVCYAMLCYMMSRMDVHMDVLRGHYLIQYCVLCHCWLCRAADKSTSFANFKPAPEGTKFAYQFVTQSDQKYGLYPQLANATPFVVGDTYIDAVVNNNNTANGPVFQPPKNDYAQTYELGRKDSKTRKQYDTGEYDLNLCFRRINWHNNHVETLKLFCLSVKYKSH